MQLYAWMGSAPQKALLHMVFHSAVERVPGKQSMVPLTAG